MSKKLEGSSYILNPISNVNGYLTSAEEIFDLNQEKSQSELNELFISLNSGVSDIYEYYAVYNSSEYNGEDMINDPDIEWVMVPSPSGADFPLMTLENPYLWNYEVFVQTKGDNVVTKPHVTGILGRGIKTRERFYLISNQTTKPNANDSGWIKNESPATTPEKPYLWEKELVYYSDNSQNGTPDETIITLIGRMGEPGIDGTQYEYIFKAWGSKISGPENPTPENFKDNTDYQKDDYHEGGWSDEPVSISKDLPAQWMCRREKVKDETGNYYWDSFSDPSLYSTYGEDGVGIKNITVKYLISNQDVLTKEGGIDISNASDGGESGSEPNKWYNQSPKVTNEYKYLWKKTITEFTENLSTKYSYEVIGSMGDPGIDGDTVEWIYTRTKTNESPAIDYTNGGKEDDNYIPYPNEDDFKNERATYYWSDDLQPIDKIYKFGWRAQRKKTLSDKGIQEWQDFNDPVLILERAEDGTTPNRAFKSIVFARSNSSSLETPNNETKDGYNTYNNPIPPTKDGIVWSDGIPSGSATLWSSTRIFSSDGEAPQQSSWTIPQIMSDSTDLETIYSGLENYNNIPSNFSKTDNEISSAWITAANESGWFITPDECNNDPIWMAISKKINGSWSNWEISKIKGERGDDGTSIKVSGSYDTIGEFENYWKDGEGNWIDPTNKEKPNKPGEYYTEESCFIVEGNLYVWNGSNAWENVGQFKGDRGATQYLHVLYASKITRDDNGVITDIDLTEGNVPGKYIATYSDESSSLKTDFNYIKTLNWWDWKGQDGYGYEYIYILTTEYSAPDLPTNNEGDESSNNIRPDGWSRDPLSVDEENPYCWQAYRIKTEGLWSSWKGHSNTNKAILWSKFAKDGKKGNGIVSINTWYCISDIDSQEKMKQEGPEYPINEDSVVSSTPVPGEINTISPKTWYRTSPEVTDDYRFLWKKTITEYEEPIEENGTIGIETRTVYELIGSKGQRGVDGTDIEWAYILTADFTCPTSKNTEWPEAKVTGTTPGEWTDDAQEVSSDFPYQWVIKRSKTNNEWSNWGIIQIDENNEEYYKATLNNTYGNYITATTSYYLVSNDEKLQDHLPENASLTLGDYKKALENYGWISNNGSGLNPTATENKVYEITIFEYSDNTFTLAGPSVKAVWNSQNIQSTVFRRSNSVPANPTGGSYDSPWPTNTDSNEGTSIWFDSIPEGTETVWSSMAVFEPGAEEPRGGTWSTPLQMTNTSSFQVIYSSQSEDSDPELPELDKDGVIVNLKGWTESGNSDTVWMATRTKSYGIWNDWTKSKIKGEAGQQVNPNLVLNSAFDNSTDWLKYWTVLDRNKVLKLTNIGEQYLNGISSYTEISYDLSSLENNKTYTISFNFSYDCQAQPAYKPQFWINGMTVESSSSELEKKSGYYTHKSNILTNQRLFFTITTTGSAKSLLFKCSQYSQSYTYSLNSLKVEKGSVVTDWMRAVEPGEPGEDGRDGSNGKDGLSPKINILNNSSFAIPRDGLICNKWDTLITIGDSMVQLLDNSWAKIEHKIFKCGMPETYSSSRKDSDGNFIDDNADVLTQDISLDEIKPNTWYTLSFYTRGWNISSTLNYPLSTLFKVDNWSLENSFIDSNTGFIINGIENNTNNSNAPLGSIEWKTKYYGDTAEESYLSSEKEWERCTFTFKTKTEIPSIKSISLHFRQWGLKKSEKTSSTITTLPPTGAETKLISYIEITEPKLEEGKDATPWSNSTNDLVGPVGASGNNMYPAGNWNSERLYKIENNSVPFVFFNSQYWILLSNEAPKGIAPAIGSEHWGVFEHTPFQFSEFLMANWAKFGGEYGAVFYDKFLFSQYGHGNKNYWDYMEGSNPMFNTEGNLSGSFIPKLHLDFYNGLANLSCLCEPYVTYKVGEDSDGVIKIDPKKGFNVKIACNCPDGPVEPGYSLPMLHPVVVLPNLTENSGEWAMDGSHVTILFENGGDRYGNLSAFGSSSIDKQNVFLLVCVDFDLNADNVISPGTQSFNQNFIFCNNKRGKYVILSPGAMVKFKVNIVTNPDNDSEKYLHWTIENSGAIKTEKVHVYQTSSLVPNQSTEGSQVNLNGQDSDKLICFYGADYSDSVNLSSTLDWYENSTWGLMFYSGPNGFCPKNILFSTSNSKYKYRALDFIGKPDSESNLLPMDSANMFSILPLEG